MVLDTNVKCWGSWVVDFGYTFVSGGGGGDFHKRRKDKQRNRSKGPLLIHKDKSGEVFQTLKTRVVRYLVRCFEVYCLVCSSGRGEEVLATMETLAGNTAKYLTFSTLDALHTKAPQLVDRGQYVLIVIVVSNGVQISNLFVPGHCTPRQRS